MSRNERLSDRTPAVVGDQIHVIDPQVIEKGVRHLNLRGRREALPGSDLGVTQAQEIEGNAPLMGR
jgi:hypothetical protein